MSDLVYPGSELELFAGADRWKRYFGSKLARYVGRRVLEVGAGLGETTARLCDGTQATWTCLEPDPELHAELARRCEEGLLPECCVARHGVVAHLGGEESFDTILYVDVLEHIEDDAGEFRAASRHLDRGGHLIVLSPAHPSLYSPFDAHVGHFRRYDRRSLAALAADGMEAVSVFQLDSVGLLLSLANRLALRQELPTAAQIAVWDRWVVPMSRVVDPLTFHRFGRSIVGVWRRGTGTDR